MELNFLGTSAFRTNGSASIGGSLREVCICICRLDTFQLSHHQPKLSRASSTVWYGVRKYTTGIHYVTTSISPGLESAQVFRAIISASRYGTKQKYDTYERRLEKPVEDERKRLHVIL